MQHRVLSQGQDGSEIVAAVALVRAALYDRHTALLSRLQKFTSLAAETSTLLLDPYAATYFLMDTVVSRLPPLQQAVAHLRNEGAALLVQQSAGLSSEIITAAVRLGGQSGGVNDLLGLAQERLDSLQRADEALTAGYPYAYDLGKALNAAAERFLSRFTRKQFFFAAIAVTALNYLLAYTVPGYRSIYLAMIGGWLGLVSAVGLMVLGPTIWVQILGHEKAIFPYEYPALFSMLIAFVGIWFFSVTDKSKAAENERALFFPQFVRSQTGLGASGAVSH